MYYKRKRRDACAGDGSAQSPGDARNGSEMAGKPPSFHHPQTLNSEREKNQYTYQGADTDQRQSRACDRIVDYIERPRQANDNQDRQDRYASHAVDQYRIACCWPSGPAASEQPDTNGVAPDRRWQDLTEKL